jgi:hypothetical protein
MIPQTNLLLGPIGVLAFTARRKGDTCGNRGASVAMPGSCAITTVRSSRKPVKEGRAVGRWWPPPMHPLAPQETPPGRIPGGVKFQRRSMLPKRQFRGLGCVVSQSCCGGRSRVPRGNIQKGAVPGCSARSRRTSPVSPATAARLHPRHPAALRWYLLHDRRGDAFDQGQRPGQRRRDGSGSRQEWQGADRAVIRCGCGAGWHG